MVNSAIKAPSTPGVKFHNAVSVFLSGQGGVKHVINNVGSQSSRGHNVNYVCEWSSGRGRLMELSTPDRDYSSIFDVGKKAVKKVKKIIRKVIIHHKKKPALAPAPANPPANSTKPVEKKAVVAKEDPKKKKDLAHLDKLPFFHRMNEIGQFKNSFLEHYNTAEDAETIRPFHEYHDTIHEHRHKAFDSIVPFFIL